MASALKFSGEISIHDALGQLDAHHPGAEAEHIGIVVALGHGSGIGIAAGEGPDVLHLVGCQGNADTRAADGDAAVCLPLCHQCGHLIAGDGIIITLRGIRTYIDHLNALFLQILLNLLLHFYRCMIISDGNLHIFSFYRLFLGHSA